MELWNLTMNQVKPTKPTPEALKAYALGKLQGPERAAVEQYLALCDTACNELNNTQDDTLLEKLKEVGEETQIPEDEEDAEHEIPEELANHPKYQILGILGEGGMGVVYKAQHRVMDRMVALKTISQRVLKDKGSLARFTREVKAAAALQHPNIVTAHDAEQAGNLHFLVTELVEGRSLDRVVNEEGPMSVPRACDCMRQAALGLQHAHQREMVHRDIKPHNLMLTPEGQVKILDFGLARLRDTEAIGAITRSDVVIGTPDFISPEQVENSSSVDFPSDIYSLGCTMYYLLTGSPPFPQPSLLAKLSGHFEGTPEPISSYRNDVPPELERFLMHRMMAKRPDQRPRPSELAQALSRFASSRTATPVVGSSGSPPLVAQVARPVAAPPPVVTPVVQQAASPGLGPFQTEIESAADRLKPRRKSSGFSKYALPIGIPAAVLAAIVLGAIMMSGGDSEPQANKQEETSLPRAVAQHNVRRDGFGNLNPGEFGFDSTRRPETEFGEGYEDENWEEPIELLPSDVASLDNPRDFIPQYDAENGEDPLHFLIAVPKENVWKPDYQPIVDYLRGQGAVVRTVSPDGKVANFAENQGDCLVQGAFNEQDPNHYDAVIFVSGEVEPYIDGCCAENTRYFVTQMLKDGKVASSICLGNVILAKQEFLRGIEAARSPAAKGEVEESDAKWRDQFVAQAFHPKYPGLIVTGSHDEAAEEFAKLLLQQTYKMRQRNMEQ